MKKRMHEKGSYWIKNTDCINKRIAGRSEREYYDEHKERLTEYKKEWALKNKEKLAEYRKNYYIANIERKRQYAHDNKEKRKEYNKAYRALCKERLLDNDTNE